MNPLNTAPTHDTGVPPVPPEDSPKSSGQDVKAKREDFARRCGLRVMVQDEACGFVAYTDGARLLAVFTGRRTKRDFYERHRDMAGVQARCDAALKVCRELAEERRAAKQGQRGVSVGDVLVCSWGYEQTNIDFYEVVALNGAQSATLRKIAAESNECAPTDMQGAATPQPGAFVGSPFLVRMRDESCLIGGSMYAKKLHPLRVVDGLREWPLQRWTAYA
ncbi:hypothetical protein [Thiomonas arsenitoxydans]|nr:hypothetical protein [Thiomonas arsenitoxydans]